MPSKIRSAFFIADVRERGPLLTALICLLGGALIVGAVWVQRHGHRMPKNGKPQQRAFYFWKTQWATSPVIAQTLVQHGITRLYMRFFDVDWDEPSHAAVPVSPLKLGSPPPAGAEVIPVVFIKNSVFRSVADAEVDSLAAHIWQKIHRMAEVQGIGLHEVQLDCDWSPGTHARYFRFLTRIKKLLHEQKIVLSSTIRLHQVKYPERTGVPPVDRGMLMLYNFGALQAEAPRSSIFNVQDARRYASYIAAYSLPLDIALPMFSWLVHSRDGSVIGLLEKVEVADLEGAGAFRCLAPGRYQSERALFFRGHYFMAGDQIEVEETTPAVTQQAAELAAQSAAWNRPYSTVALFDLDERNLRHYAASDLQKIFAAFH